MYGLVRPCKLCPFRSDIDPYLNRARVREIVESLRSGAIFPCHETTEFDDDGEPIRNDGEIHCAGALIVMEREEEPNQMMRIAERLGSYDRSKLVMDAPVFDSFEEMIEAQPRSREKVTR